MDAYALLIFKIPRRNFVSATNVLKPIRGYSKSVNDGESQEHQQHHGLDFRKAPSLADEFHRVAEEKAAARQMEDKQNGVVDSEQQRNVAAGGRSSSTDGKVSGGGSSEDGRNPNRSE